MEGETKKHKMVVPKGPISDDMWRTISRGIDEIEEICEKAEENLHVSKDDTYQETDLYDEITAWRTLLRSSKMLDTNGPKGVMMNIYGEVLCDDIIGLTENAIELMERFVKLKLQSKSRFNKFLKK